jgi:membrane protease subunit (stomatin/prohibitin family)
MSLWDKFLGEFVDIVEWIDDSADTLVYRFERHGNEIKYGAMLTVRESQAAVFVNEGQIADVFGPGMYKLETNNLPVLSTLQSWPHGFHSPFKAEVYFFNLRNFTDLKWGTRNPIVLRDPEFVAVRLRAFGAYAFRIGKPDVFLREIVGTDGRFTTDEITEHLRNLIVSRFSALLGSSNIPVLDLAANYEQLSDFVATRLKPEFEEYGLTLSKFLVENISLPDEVSAALDKRTSMGLVRDLHDYVTFQTGAALEKAAANPAGGGSEGIGMGMAFAVAQQMGQQMAMANKPPSIPEVSYFVAVEGGQKGPYTFDQLRGLVKENQFTPEMLVWAQGMPTWSPAGQMASLKSLFASLPVPPPLPKQS